MERWDAASIGIVDDSDGNAAVVVAAADIDSSYFRYFRFHPCTTAIVVVAAVDSPNCLAL